MLGLIYNKIISGRGSAPDPAGRAYDALPDPGYFLPICLGIQGRLIILLNWYPTFYTSPAWEAKLLSINYLFIHLQLDNRID